MLQNYILTEDESSLESSLSVLSVVLDNTLASSV